MGKAAELLELVSTKDLADEILRRHDWGVICAGRAAKHGAGNDWLLLWSGPAHACIGMMTHVAASLTKTMADAGKNTIEEPGDSDGD